MAVVEIKCPKCGAKCIPDSQKPDAYTCPYCNASFRFVDSSRRVVTRDVQIRNCIFCGKPIEAGKGFKCTECTRAYFCNDCVDRVQNKFVCFDCIEKSKNKCAHCRRYSVYKCLWCGKKACKEHALLSRFIQSPLPANSRGTVVYCPKCQSFVCYDCVKMPFFGTGQRCPKCNTRLVAYAPYE